MAIAADVKIGKEVRILHPELVNLYGCTIGDRTRIDAFVEIQRNVVIGVDGKISSHSVICEGVTLEDRVFIGHGVMFTNELYPRAGETAAGGGADDKIIPTRVCTGASIGSGAVIRAGVTIGRNAMVGAGAVVVKDVPDDAIVVGVPERMIGRMSDRQRTNLELC